MLEIQLKAHFINLFVKTLKSIKCTLVFTKSRFDTYVIVHQRHVHTKDFDLRSRVFDRHLTLDLYYMSYQLAC